MSMDDHISLRSYPVSSHHADEQNYTSNRKMGHSIVASGRPHRRKSALSQSWPHGLLLCALVILLRERMARLAACVELRTR